MKFKIISSCILESLLLKEYPELKKYKVEYSENILYIVFDTLSELCKFSKEFCEISLSGNTITIDNENEYTDVELYYWNNVCNSIRRNKEKNNIFKR